MKQYSFSKRQTDATRWQNVGAAQWVVRAKLENNGWLPARSLPIVHGGTARNVEIRFHSFITNFLKLSLSKENVKCLTFWLGGGGGGRWSENWIVQCNVKRLTCSTVIFLRWSHYGRCLNYVNISVAVTGVTKNRWVTQGWGSGTGEVLYIFLQPVCTLTWFSICRIYWAVTVQSIVCWKFTNTGLSTQRDVDPEV